jgi:hypothetical protein
MALRKTMDDRAKRILDFAKKHFVTEYSFDDSEHKLPITKQYFLTALPLISHVAQKVAFEEAHAWQIEVAMACLSRLAGHREATSSGFYFAMQEKMDGNIEVLSLQKNEDWFYSIIVLDRDPRTPVNDPNKWNPEAWICDITRGIEYSPFVMYEKLNLNDKIVFCIRHRFYGKQTPENLQENETDIITIKNVQQKLRSNQTFHKLVFEVNDMKALSEHFKQFLPKEKLEEIVELAKLGMGFTQDFLVKIKTALNLLTKDISTMQWRVDLQRRLAMLRCNSLEEATVVKTIFDNNSALNTQCRIDTIEEKPTTVVSPIPKIKDINMLIQMKEISAALQKVYSQTTN